jgi:hypothetical protein
MLMAIQSSFIKRWDLNGQVKLSLCGFTPEQSIKCITSTCVEPLSALILRAAMRYRVEAD